MGTNEVSAICFIVEVIQEHPFYKIAEDFKIETKRILFTNRDKQQTYLLASFHNSMNGIHIH